MKYEVFGARAEPAWPPQPVLVTKCALNTGFKGSLESKHFQGTRPGTTRAHDLRRSEPAKRKRRPKGEGSKRGARRGGPGRPPGRSEFWGSFKNAAGPEREGRPGRRITPGSRVRGQGPERAVNFRARGALQAAEDPASPISVGRWPSPAGPWPRAGLPGLAPARAPVPGTRRQERSGPYEIRGFRGPGRAGVASTHGTCQKMRFHHEF